MKKNKPVFTSEEKLNCDVLNLNLQEAKYIIDSMQIHNYNCDYDETIKIYNKYSSIFSKDIFLSNKMLNEYELATHKILLESKPRSIMIVLTNTCDLNCIMCYQDRRNIKNISEKLVNIVLDNLKYFEKLIWQGGEVLILPYFKNILKKTINYPNIHQVIITNFQNVSDEIIELIARNKIELIVSVDGTTKETYEKIRVGASFDKLEKNLEKLKENIIKYGNKVSLRINFVIMKDNYKEIPGIIDFAYRYNFIMVAFLRCVTEDENIKITKEYEEDVESYIKLAKEKADKYNIIVTNTFSEFNDNTCEDKVKSYIESSDKEKKGLFCHLPWYELLIQEDNTVKPHCGCVQGSPFINVDDCDNIDDLWNNAEMQKYRTKMLNSECGRSIYECKLMLSYDTRKRFNK